MATHGWGKSASVEQWLLDEGDRFDFFQAVSLLEALREGCQSVGTSVEPAREAVRFKSSVALAFPETDVRSVKAPEDGRGPFEMLVNFMGLAGALGPLPSPFAELIFQRSVRSDTAARDFLDIFNHRLISLLYRVRKRHRIGLGTSSPDRDDAAGYLFALMGLGVADLRGRLGAPDRALLYHAGTLARGSRSMAGLEAMLRHHFQAPIRSVALAGRFYPLEESDWTRLGRSGKNRRLGVDAVVGARFWDQQSSFEIHVGPLDFEAFVRFLPGGDALMPLCELIRFYAGEAFDFSVVLTLAERSAPPAKLGRQGGVRLGYTSWLGAARRGAPPREVRLKGAALDGARPRACQSKEGAAISAASRPNEGRAAKV